MPPRTARRRPAPAPAAESALAPGDRWRLVEGDAGAVLDGLPAASVHAAVTSPPYWGVRRYAGGDGLGNERTPEAYVARLVAILARLERVLRPDGSLWLNLGDSYAGKGLVGVPWRVALALQARGWMIRNAVVWDKVKGNPCNARDRLRDMYEHVFHLVRGPRFHYDADAIRSPPRPPTVRGDGAVVTPTGVSGIRYRRQIAASDLTAAERRAALAALEDALGRVRDGRLSDFRMILRGVQRATHGGDADFSGRAGELARKGWAILPYHPKGSKPGDVWRIVPEDSWRTDAHAAVFPVELCRIPILATCPPGGVVLDPFAGTGTTLVAAVALGRRAIGVDVSGEYLAVAEGRLRRASVGPERDVDRTRPGARSVQSKWTGAVQSAGQSGPVPSKPGARSLAGPGTISSGGEAPERLIVSPSRRRSGR